MAEHSAEKAQVSAALDTLPVDQRDDVIAQVMEFLLGRGYTIFAPGGQRVFPPEEEGS